MSMSKKEKAMAYFKEGFNCSQSVFLAFAEEYGLNKQTALKLSASFGGGMGRMREVCGSVSGMLMAAGLIYGYDSPNDNDAKREHYKRVQQLAGEFREKNGSIICRELLGQTGKDNSFVPSERTDEYYKKRPCAELVGDAAEILEKYIIEYENVIKNT